jgi:hypothetical protein
MVAYIFQKIAEKGRSEGITKGTVDARQWFRNEASTVSIGSVTPNKLIEQSRGRLYPAVSQQDIGRMYMFLYDAKTKNELPYWDKFPLIFVIEKYNDGFLGINLHYLPLVIRAKLMDALYAIERNDSLRQSKKLRMTYNILNSAARYRFFKPCIKRYLTNHVKSRYLYIPYDDWDTALFLPTERFTKTNKLAVWNDSRKAISPRKP